MGDAVGCIRLHGFGLEQAGQSLADRAGDQRRHCIGHLGEAGHFLLSEMAAGDYLYTVPGEEHDVVAVTDTVIFVSSQRATPGIGR